jgi:hypothetical protein
VLLALAHPLSCNPGARLNTVPVCPIEHRPVVGFDHSQQVLQKGSQIKLVDIGELAQRIDRMRQTCTDLDAAIGAAGLHRELLDQLKHDTDEVYRTLLLEGLDRRKRRRT